MGLRVPGDKSGDSSGLPVGDTSGDCSGLLVGDSSGDASELVGEGNGLPGPATGDDTGPDPAPPAAGDDAGPDPGPDTGPDPGPCATGDDTGPVREGGPPGVPGSAGGRAGLVAG